jgi:lipopolysaccharide transport system permease protein
VKYRDVRHALPFLMQIWLYVSPIVYPASVVPQKWRLLYSLNPVVGIVEGYRSALFGRDFDWAALGISAALTTAVLFYAALAFRRMERSFADLV